MNEKFFDYGTEGGGETLYREVDNGQIAFYTEGSRGGIEPDEPVKKWKKNYVGFEDFWNKFIENKNWFLFYPIFIHDDAKETVKKELEKIESDVVYKAHTKHAWERAVKIITDKEDVYMKKRIKDLYD